MKVKAEDIRRKMPVFEPQKPDDQTRPKPLKVVDLRGLDNDNQPQ